MIALLPALILWAYPFGAQADLSPLEKDFRSLCQALKMKCAKAAPRKNASVSEKEKAQKALIPVPRSKPAAPVKKPTASKAVTLAEKKSEPLQVGAENPLAEKKASPDNETVIAKTPADRTIPVKRQPEPEKQIATVVRPRKDTAATAKSKPPQAAPETGCLAQLRDSGVKFEALSPVGNGSCRVDIPVRIHSVETTSGKIYLPDSPILSCRFARQFALWLSDTGAALVSAHMDMNLAKVSTGPGYECRGRHGAASAKLSEHAFGNAVDITTIATADGRRIQISDASNSASRSYKVLRGLRTTACGYFTTVLGPGSNEAHAEHFHFDMGMHGKSQNYRICE